MLFLIVCPGIKKNNYKKINLLSKGVYVITSDLCDYEVRRGLVLAAKKNPNINGLEELDELQDIISFLPVNSAIFREAAILWAEARSRGIPTADEKSLDVDMILCAQWKSLAEEFSGRYIVIATINVKHLSRFSEANLWREIIVWLQPKLDFIPVYPEVVERMRKQYNKENEFILVKWKTPRPCKKP